MSALSMSISGWIDKEKLDLDFHTNKETNKTQTSPQMASHISILQLCIYELSYQKSALLLFVIHSII